MATHRPLIFQINFKISLVFWELSTMDLGVNFFLCIYLGLILSPAFVDFFPPLVLKKITSIISSITAHPSSVYLLFLGLWLSISFCFLHLSSHSFIFFTFFPPCMQGSVHLLSIYLPILLSSEILELVFKLQKSFCNYKNLFILSFWNYKNLFVTIKIFLFWNIYSIIFKTRFVILQYVIFL